MNLHEAINKDNTTEAINLINGGADIEAVGSFRQTPLHHAILKKNLEIITILLERGANTSALDRIFQTPLHYAAMCGLIAIIQPLLNRDSYIDACNNTGHTPLTLAVVSGHTEMVNILLDKGAYTEAITYDGYTPLALAASLGRAEMVNILLAKGADIEAITYDGYTPLHIAIKDNYSEIVNTLLDSGADISALDKDKNTPLHKAAFYCYPATVRILIERNANIHTVNSNGQTPLMYHMENIIDDYSRLLLLDNIDIFKRQVECALNLIGGDAKELIELMIQNNDWRSTIEYLQKQYKNATYDKSKTEENTIKNIIIDCAKALFGMATTDKAKALLKIKISFFKYKEKDPYTKTTILLKGIRNLGFEAINNIISFAGFCDSPIDLEHITPISSKEIQSEKEPRDLSHTANMDSINQCMLENCNIAQ